MGRQHWVGLSALWVVAVLAEDVGAQTALPPPPPPPPDAPVQPAQPVPPATVLPPGPPAPPPVVVVPPPSDAPWGWPQWTAPRPEDAPPPMLAPDAPLTLAWEPGDPVPPGYSVHNVQQTGMLIAGGAALAVSYGPTFVYGYLAELANGLECSLGSKSKCDRAYWPLLVPFAGPFIGFATTEPSGAGVGLLLASGITQIAGGALFISGLAMEEKLLIRNDRRWGVVPMLQPRAAGAAVTGAW